MCLCSGSTHEDHPHRHRSECAGFGRIWEEEIPDPPKSPIHYGKAEFKRFCYTVLGKLVTPAGTQAEILQAGLAAFGNINRQASASTNDVIFQIWDEYNKADKFDKATVIQMMAFLQGAGIMTPQQVAAISAAWEESF